MEPKEVSIDLTRTQIIEGDVLEVLSRISDGSVDLCVTSPPYNIGKAYEKGSFPTFSDYRAWMETVLTNIHRVIRDGGNFCLQVGNHVENGRVTPLDYIFAPMLFDLGFTLRNRIIWRFNFGLHAQRRLSGRYETLLWFSKGDDYKFNLDPIRVEQLYPGKRHPSSKGDRAGKPSGNRNGKNPSDYWEFDPEGAFFGESVWDIPNVKANHLEKTIHPCQFPNELAERCVLAFSDPGDVILDPFVGTGTTAICAHGRGRIGVGIDVQSEYVANARNRLCLLNEGKLPLRQSGKPPTAPSRKDKVAIRPSEWAA